LEYEEEFMSEKYPLTRKLLETVAPFEEFIITSGVNSMVHLDDLEGALQKAPQVVVQHKNIDGGLTKDKVWCASQINNTGETHAALLVCIEEIKPKEVKISKEKLADELAAVIAPLQINEKLFSNLCERLGL
jgi:hypothetical protein